MNATVTSEPVALVFLFAIPFTISAILLVAGLLMTLSAWLARGIRLRRRA